MIRTEGTVKDWVTGAVFKTTKGAPHVILKLVHNESVTAQVMALRFCVVRHCISRFDQCLQCSNVRRSILCFIHLTICIVYY